jgi:NADH-quinone oxidoreductase subunit M
VRAPGEPPDANDPELRPAVPDMPEERLRPVMGGSGTDDPRSDPHYIDPRTFPDINWKEILMLAPLAILTLWVGVYPSTLIDIVKPALQAILMPFGGSGF